MQRCLTPDEKAKVLRLPELRRALAAAPPPSQATPPRLPPPVRQAPPPMAAAVAAAVEVEVEEGDAGAHRRLALAREYLSLVEKHPTPLPCVLFHLRRICKTLLGKYQAMDELLAASGALEEAVEPSSPHPHPSPSPSPSPSP